MDFGSACVHVHMCWSHGTSHSTLLILNLHTPWDNQLFQQKRVVVVYIKNLSLLLRGIWVRGSPPGSHNHGQTWARESRINWELQRISLSQSIIRGRTTLVNMHLIQAFSERHVPVLELTKILQELDKPCTFSFHQAIIYVEDIHEAIM